MAAADNAQAVYFLADDDDCLSIEIDGEKFEMEPPPEELREAFLRAARELALGGKFQYFLRRALPMNRAGEYIGSTAVNSRIGESEWQVFDHSTGCVYKM
jgi:hypothetical protein